MYNYILKITVVILAFLVTTTTFAQSTAKKNTKKKTTTTIQKLPPNTKIFFVDAERAKCEGVTTMQCLMVKKQGQKEYELFYDNIEGFNYEAGNTYTIWVREELKTPPIAADESMYKYVYVKTIAKKNISNQNNTTVKDDISKPQSGMNFSKQTTLIINETKTACEGNPDAKCLLIKKDGAKEFEIFYQGIDGFVFEEGYRQTILVNERHIPNPMIKQTKPIYTLVKVISKEKIKDITVGKEKILIINEEKTACEGNPNAKCLLIKEEGTKEFEVFYQGITGFVFEEGVRQTILVNERYVGNPMVKQAEPIYTLIKVIRKLKVSDVPYAAPAVPITPLDKKWVLRKMKESDTSSFAIDDDGVWIEFNYAENKFNGKAPCNNFFGGFKTDLISSFKASAPASTKMYCGNMPLENLFFKLLEEANSYTLKDEKLSLLKDGKLLMLFE